MRKIINIVKKVTDTRKYQLRYLREFGNYYKQFNEEQGQLVNWIINVIKEFWGIVLVIISLLMGWYSISIIILLFWVMEVPIRYFINLNKIQRKFINRYFYYYTQGVYDTQSYFYTVPIRILKKDKKVFQDIEFEKEKWAIKLAIERKGHNKDIENIILSIFKNKNEWKFMYKGFYNESLRGNQYYAILKCVYDTSKNGNIQFIKGLKHELEANFGYKVSIQEATNKTTFNLVVHFIDEPEELIIDSQRLESFNQNRELLLGNALEGICTANFNSGKANHMLITGSTGSGKTTTIKTMIMNLINLGFNKVLISSGLKTADFIALEKKGALCKGGEENMLLILDWLFEEIKRRESLLQKYNLTEGNVNEYNAIVNEDEQLESILLVADEFETALNSKKGKDIDNLMAKIVANARAYNILVIIGTQTPLIEAIGKSERLIGNRFIGSCNKLQLQSRYPELANFYDSYDGNTEGLFFYRGQFLKPTAKHLYYGNSRLIQLKTPFIKDFNDSIPSLSGSEVCQELGGGNVEISLEESSPVLTEELF